MSEKSRINFKLLNDKAARQAYIRSKLGVNIASQIRALRRRRKGLTQTELAKEAEMKQSRISAIERPGTSLNIETLVRLASAFHVGLVVKFVSFSEMLQWENGFSQDRFNVVSVEKDVPFLQGRVNAATPPVINVTSAMATYRVGARDVFASFGNYAGVVSADVTFQDVKSGNLAAQATLPSPRYITQ